MQWVIWTEWVFSMRCIRRSRCYLFAPSSREPKQFQGTNKRLVEIARIYPDARDDAIPGRLVDCLLSSVGDMPSRGRLETGAFTIFSELVGNVYDHVEVELDGFAVLQRYGGKRNSVNIAVSDSGLGVIETLRPALPEHYPKFQNYSESQLLVENAQSRIVPTRRSSRRRLKSHGLARAEIQRLDEHSPT